MDEHTVHGGGPRTGASSGPCGEDWLVRTGSECVQNDETADSGLTQFCSQTESLLLFSETARREIFLSLSERATCCQTGSEHVHCHRLAALSDSSIFSSPCFKALFLLQRLNEPRPEAPVVNNVTTSVC